MSLSLLHLPDDCLINIFDYFPTFELWRYFLHHPPSKGWRRLCELISHVEIDLEREIGVMRQQFENGLAGGNGNGGTHSTSINAIAETYNTSQLQQQYHHPSSDNSTANAPIMTHFDVTDMISRKKYDYTRLIEIVSHHTRDLQSLALDNFGVVLNDDIEDGSSGGLKFQDVLNVHSHSLITLSLVGSQLQHLTIDESFESLESLDLSKCRALSAPLLSSPSIVSLDLSRTLLNDYELLKILPIYRAFASCV